MRKRTTGWLAAIGILVLAAGGRAAARSPNAPAPCAAPEYRALDFWIGDWDVYDAGDRGKPIARARVTGILGGCVLRELYEGADGLVGESFTIYDAGRKLWHQTWVTNSGKLLSIEGRFQGASLTLQGVQHSPDGRAETVRGVWTREDGGVREIAHTSADAGATWQLWFDIVFRKRE